jgi:fructan beta-fructosidase
VNPKNPDAGMKIFCKLKKMKRFFLYLVFFYVSAGINAQDKEIATPQWRPLFHFTPLKNWTNDPNGLIYLNGVYNLYNQQNPYENKWGHMSWGHATSTDLVHWKHLPIAMPESITGSDTLWRFSGCAVLDSNNTSHLCKTKNCIVAIYTVHQPHIKNESQYIAYSNDGGMHFINYAHNPVIDLHLEQFRDPNVQWNKQLKKWLMVVAMPLEHKVRFYASANLIDWDLLSEFGPAGITGEGVWECPSFFKLPVQGEPGKSKWVLMTSFANQDTTKMQYFIGDFDGTHFVDDNPTDSTFLVDNGNCFYAAIPWNNLPAGQHIYIGWMVPPPQQTFPWRGQMSIPRDLILKNTTNGIRLFQEPAAVIENNLTKLAANHVYAAKNILVSDKKDELIPKANGITKGNCYWLKAKLKVGKDASAGFSIARETDRDDHVIAETKIGYDSKHQMIYIDRTHSGPEDINRNYLVQSAQVSPENGTIELKILFDKSSLEVFGNYGERVITAYVYPGKDAKGFAAFSENGSAKIESLQIWDLSGLKN